MTSSRWTPRPPSPSWQMGYPICKLQNEPAAKMPDGDVQYELAANGQRPTFQQRVHTPEGRIELWGGVECSIVRVGDEFRRQLDETGHLHRLTDLQLIADLGVRVLRY